MMNPMAMMQAAGAAQTPGTRHVLALAFSSSYLAGIALIIIMRSLRWERTGRGSIWGNRVRDIDVGSSQFFSADCCVASRLHHSEANVSLSSSLKVCNCKVSKKFGFVSLERKTPG